MILEEKFKKIIAYALSLPYVFKVEIIILSINKEDKDSNFYRWQGGAKTKDVFKYLKAWNCKFKYHEFKIDMNNEHHLNMSPMLT